MLKVEVIPREKPERLRRLRAVPCSKKVKSCGTFLNERMNRCDRFATVRVDGIPFCTQHAGEAALKYIMDNQE